MTPSDHQRPLTTEGHLIKHRTIIASASALALTLAACGAAASTVGPAEQPAAPGVETVTETAVETAEARDDLTDAKPSDADPSDNDHEGDSPWYRDLRISRWTWLGADEASITNILDRIATRTATAPTPTCSTPSTPTRFGPASNRAIWRDCRG